MNKTGVSRAMAAVLALASISAAPAPHYAVASPIAGPDGSFDYASVDPATGQLYVARGENATVVDLAHPESVRSIGTIAHGHAVVPIPDLGLLLVTSGHDDSVRLLDPTDGREVAKIAVGTDPDGAFYDAAAHRAVVMNAKAGTVSVIDVASAKVLRTLTLKAGLEFGALGRDGVLFVNNENTNEIETANLDTGVAGASIALTGCVSPSGLAYDARNNVLISACANGKAAVVDAGTRREVALLDIGKGPDAVILDAARRLAFIPCGKSGTLTVLSLASGHVAVTGTVTTETGAKTGALDPRDGALYLPTARFGPPATPGARGVAIPGTFHIVTVKPQHAR
jgi:DNA-binding beta-propeller fold protein YncE